MLRASAFFSFTVFLLAHAQTLSEDQSGRDGCAIWGQVLVPSASARDKLEVELVDTKHKQRQRTRVVNGGFDFQTVPPGIYQFRLFDPTGSLITKRTMSLTGTHDRVILRAPSVEGTISLNALNHPISMKARSAFLAAERASDAGDARKSIEYLEKALNHSPEFPEAHVKLAVLYSSLGRDSQAIRHVQRAFEINPRLQEGGYTLLILLNEAKLYEESEAVARRMLATGNNLPEVRAILAVSLLARQRNLEEAYTQLQSAATDFPMARLLAANVLTETGHIEAATIQVKEYLRSAAHECEHLRLERWVATMSRPEHLTLAAHD